MLLLSTDNEEEEKTPADKRTSIGRVLELRIKEDMEKASSLQPGKAEMNLIIH